MVGRHPRRRHPPPRYGRRGAQSIPTLWREALEARCIIIISVTERGTFKRCLQQWDYASRNRQGLTPLLPPLALGAGGLAHKALEGWLKNPSLDPQGILLAEASDFMAKVKEGYTTRIGVPPADEELAGLYEQIELVHHMLGNYRDHYGSPLPEGFTLVEAEQTIITPIPGTAHSCTAPGCLVEANLSLADILRTADLSGINPDCKECHGTGTAWHYLEATLDFIAKDAAGQLFVGEHKTYGSRPQMRWLRTNDQFVAYDWTLEQLHLGPVGGVMYDGLWKRRLEGKRTLDELFTRTLLVRGPEAIARFGTELAREAIRMAEVHDAGEAKLYRNFAWVGCWDCSFVDLCVAEMEGEDAQFVRDTRFAKREAATWLQVDLAPSEE